MSSWAEACNNYIAEKSSVPIGIQNQEPIERFTRNSGTRLAKESRSYNIVNNTVAEPGTVGGRSGARPIARTDPDYEYEKSVKASQNTHFHRAVDAHLKKPTSRTYNILTMEGVYGREVDSKDGDGTGMKKGGEGKRIDAQSNNFTDTAQYALHAACFTTPPPTPRSVAKAEAKRARREKGNHEFNIVNHEYLKDHDVKTARDRENEIIRVNTVALQGGTYNPLTTKYRHGDEEAEHVARQKAKEEKTRREFENHTYKVSNIIGQSDGHAFNIVTNEICNPDCTLSIERRHIRGMPQRAKLRDEWEHRRDEDEARAELAAKLALAKTNVNQRMAEIESRGHDIISNRPFATSTGPTSCALNATKPLVPVESLKAQTTWERLEGLQEVPEVKTSSLVRSAGPRTTHERVFVNPPSAISVATSSKEERQRLLLPVLNMSSSKPRVEEVQMSSTIGSHADSASGKKQPYQALCLKRKVEVGASTVFGTGSMRRENGGMDTFY